jgi:chromosome segregation ATPase
MKTLDSRNEDINDLRDRIEEIMAHNSKLQDEKVSLDRMVQNLNDIKSSQKAEIAKYIDDNQKLSRICQDQDKSLKANAMEISKLLTKNDELAFELKNFQGRLKSREADLNYAHKQIEDAKTTINKLQMDVRERDKQIELNRNDLSTLTGNHNLERQARLEAEKANEDLTEAIHERDREISRLHKEIDSHRSSNQRLGEDKSYLGAENDKLKNHIIMLTEQNQKVNRN